MGLTCWTAIIAAVLSVPVAVVSLAKPATRTRIEVICAYLSFASALATGILITTQHCGGATTVGELTCTYAAGGVFGVVGVLATVNDVSQISWNGTIIAKGWTKWRGPAFLIVGVALELASTIAWLHMPTRSSV